MKITFLGQELNLTLSSFCPQVFYKYAVRWDNEISWIQLPLGQIIDMSLFWLDDMEGAVFNIGGGAKLD